MKGRVPTSAPSSSRLSFYICLALIAGALLAYWPVTRAEFINFDDTDFITANPVVKKGISVEGFKWIWHSEVARNWHPVTMLSHMVDCQLFGLNAGRHHLTNLLLHIANALLLFYLFKVLTGAIWRSAFVAALFALHPLHVESVAWIAERKDLLSTFFWFLTFWAYVRYVQELKKRSAKPKLFYALALLFFALGLMSKPMLVTGPFVLLLLDFWPLGRMARNARQNGTSMLRLMAEKIPFLAMSVALCVITFSIQQHGGAVQTSMNLPLTSRIANALISYGRYIVDLFWPRHLAGLYLRSGEWPLWQVAAAGLTLLGVSIIAFMQWRKRPWLAMGWFWYLGILVPVIGLVQVGMQARADRFTYVSLIGIFVIVTWLACEWIRNRTLLACLGGISLLACIILTRQQVVYWHDSETFFKHIIAVTENNFMAHYNLANLYSQEKRTDEAAANYQAAIDEEPNYADAHNNFGGLLLEQKRYDEAIGHYRAALRINTQYLAYFNLANALADAASARHDTDEFAEAVTMYRQALQLNPAAFVAHNNLGLTWAAQGREEEAMAEFREAIRLSPSYEAPRLSLADTLSHLGKLDEAIEVYRAAESLFPDTPELYNGLGVCYAVHGKMADAAQQFEELVRLQPGNSGANGNLGNALAAQNKFAEAIPYYLTAIRLNPLDYQTEFNLGLTFSREGKRAEAETHFQQALRLKPNYPEAQRALQALPK